MAAIQCKVEIPKVSGLVDNELTVGREFHLLCEGDFAKNFNFQKAHFVKAPEQKYLIHFLKGEFVSQTQADLIVTSYAAGDIRWTDLQMTDDQQTISLGSLQYHVESVLPKPDPSKQVPGQEPAKTEAYGPIGPASLSIPPLYWMLLLGVLILFVSAIVIKVIRIMQRRNMLERLKEHDSAVAPLPQFHQSMRKLQRMHPAFFGGNASKEEVLAAIEEMHKMLRLYVTRKYQMPAMEWSSRWILRDLKKYHRKVYQECGVDLQALIKEYQHAFENKQSVTGNDVPNLAKRTRSLVELMESLS